MNLSFWKFAKVHVLALRGIKSWKVMHEESGVAIALHFEPNAAIARASAQLHKWIKRDNLTE
jgi:hypothetical protein